MKVAILYHPESEHAREVEDYARDYGQKHTRLIELVSLETRAGADLAKLYDVVSYPAVLVMQDDNQLVKYWEGTPLPLMDEVASYAR